MPRTEPALTFHLLHDSPLLTVQDYCCRAEHGGPAGEEHCDGNHIVLLRRGVFCKHIGRLGVTADVNQVIFFSRGSTYRVSHPASCGDRGTVFVPSPRVLIDIVGELDPAVEDRPERPIPFLSGPCDPGVFWRHRELLRRLAPDPAEPPEQLWADVTGLQIVADVVKAAYAQHDLPQRRRPRTDAAHVERVEAAKTYLAARLGERIALDEVARAVHVSPFHLARVFRQRTGVPLHRYLTRLRLRAALDRLADGARDLTALGLELGFCSHSHFTDAFRRELGCSPSQVRRKLAHQALREMSKKLKA